MKKEKADLIFTEAEIAALTFTEAEIAEFDKLLKESEGGYFDG